MIFFYKKIYKYFNKYIIYIIIKLILIVYPAEILPAEGMGVVGCVTWIWSLSLVIVFPILL